MTATLPVPHAPAHDGRRTDLARVRRVLGRARTEGRRRLLEPEAREVLEAIGVGVPRAVVLALGEAVTGDGLASLRTERVVVKVVAEAIAHKTEVGGVAIVDRRPNAVRGAIDAMVERLGPDRPTGFLVSELVEHDASIGGELLVAVRWTPDFGPIATVGAGGIHAEALARDLRPGRELAVVSPDLGAPAAVEAALAASTAVRLATQSQRGRAPIGSIDDVADLVRRLLAVATLMPHELAEIEVNPAAVTPAGLVALDALVTLGDGSSPARAAGRPVWKLPCLLQPRSIAIAGVSSGENPGRTILRNVLRDGFERDRVVIVKPGADQIDGCRCVPSVADLPGRVDLLVVALAAGQATAMVADAIARDAAESIILIPGGLEETAGGRALTAGMARELAAARRRPDGGPLVNGGNCLGIRSRPGRYDTMFIPAAKLAAPSGRAAPLALVAQSGAFAITRLSRLAGLDPKYVITVGNQMDLTIGDYVGHLATDPEVRVVAVYVEGFAPLDGRRFLAAAREVRDRGGTVILYRAGRTGAGARASASHTAAIAGDALVTAALARQAGIVVAETLGAFDDLVRTFTLLDGRAIGGRRLGAMSNAGFECVAIGDNLGALELAAFEPATADRAAAILRATGAGDVVDVHDPLDLTPMGDDAAFAAAAEAILAADEVDVGLFGDVPLTGALHTLPAEAGETVDAEGSVAWRLIDLWHRSTKAWVTVVDAGPWYDPLARTLEAAGIPTFRTADAALRALAAVVEARTGAGPS